MTHIVIALVVLMVFLSLNFGWRTWRQWRTTGSTGFHGISGRVGSAEWFGGVLFVVGLVFGVMAPVLPLLGIGIPHLAVNWPLVDVFALLIAVLGIVGTTWAQLAMGASWRIGVQESERTEFIAHGPFRWVRNPIFTSIIMTAAGLAAFLPNALSLASVVSLVVAIELQVRFVEEPYLSRIHGEGYDRYRRAVGRFVPGLGRLKEAP